MPERINEVRTFELSYTCDGEKDAPCEGMMIPSGSVLQTSPPMFQHRCKKCGNVKYLPNQYPQLMSLKIGDEIPPQWIDKLDRVRQDIPGEIKPAKKIVLS